MFGCYCEKTEKARLQINSSSKRTMFNGFVSFITEFLLIKDVTDLISPNDLLVFPLFVSKKVKTALTIHDIVSLLR